MPHGNKDYINPLVFGGGESYKWCINILCWKILVFSRKRLQNPKFGIDSDFEPTIAGKSASFNRLMDAVLCGRLDCFIFCWCL